MSLISMTGPTIQAILGRTRTRLLKLRDLRSAHARSMLVIEKWILKNFETEGELATDGARWVPLKQATIERRRHGKNKALAGKVMILQDRGYLKTHWKPFYSPWKVAYQSMEDYGIYHDKGSGRLPQRRIIPRQYQVRAALRKVYLKHVQEALK